MLFVLINYLFYGYSLAIVIYVFMSWFPGAYQSALGRWLRQICEPYLQLFNFIPPIMGLSFAPLVALIALRFIHIGLLFVLEMLLRIVM